MNNNNGQITGITDSVDAGRTVNYTYDALNRLTFAITTGSVPSPKWGLRWTYDLYGNPLAQTQFKYDAPPMYSVSVGGTTNRIVGDTYDSNGNLTVEPMTPLPPNNYSYDGENRLASFQGGSSSANYSYDGNGLRVQKTSGGTTTTYIFSGGQVIAEYAAGAAPASPTREYIYGTMSELTATIQGGTATYHLRDQLSVRVNADANGNKIGEQGHYPYGESWYASGTTTKWQFTNYERDAESANDYAIARYYVNRLGRFFSPDPVDGNPASPQTLGLYAYVTDDPVNFTDPDGRLTPATCGGPGRDPGNPFGTPPYFPGGGFPWPVWWPGGGGSVSATPPFFPADPGGGTEGGGGRRCICGCPCSDWVCRISGWLFGCKPPPGCKETIYSSPGPAANQCAGLTPPHIFVEEWSCEGDVPCCREKQSAYIISCYDRGRGYVAWPVPALRGGIDGTQCCKPPN